MCVVTKALDRAIKQAGGLTAFAHKVDASPQVVSNWRKRKKIPAVRVLDVERASGIPRHELRPDLYPKEREAA